MSYPNIFREGLPKTLFLLLLHGSNNLNKFLRPKTYERQGYLMQGLKRGITLFNANKKVYLPVF